MRLADSLPALGLVALSCCAALELPVPAAPPDGVIAFPIPPMQLPAPPSTCRSGPPDGVPTRGPDTITTYRQGRWVVETPSLGDDRIWELTPAGPRLAFRIEPKSYRFLEEDSILIEESHRLRLIDPARGVVHDLGDRDFVEHAPPFLFVRDNQRVLRLHVGETLSVAGEVTVGTAAGDGRALLGGRGLVTAAGVLSFDDGRVLASDLELGETSPDGARVSAIDLAAGTFIDLDAQTGLARLTFVRGPCVGCMGNPHAAYTADGRHLFWFELGNQDDEFNQRVTVAVGNTETGDVSRFEDPVLDVQALSLRAEVQGDYLCMLAASFKHAVRHCDWKLARSGKPVRAPRPRKKVVPTLAQLGIQGEVELVREKSPSGKRTAIASYRQPQQDLTLTVLDAAGRLERRIGIRGGEFPLATSGIVGDDVLLAEGTYEEPPHLFFESETTLTYVAPYFPCNEIDLETHQVDFETPRCLDPLIVADPVRGGTTRLEAPDEAWATATWVPASCPTP